LQALFDALRPRQWTKNFAVFVGLVFAQRLFNLIAFERTLLAFITFCLASSSIYLLNDLIDIEKDRLHPVKRKRPLASGRLPATWAVVGIGMLLLMCGGLIFLLFKVPLAPGEDIFAAYGGANLLFTITVIAYLLLMVLYSIRLKHVVLIDVFLLSGGFVLRILAGTVVIPVAVSPWLSMVTSLLALFMALGKRRHELILLQGQASQHRQILKEYSLPMLDQMITIVVAGTIMAYILYTFQGSTGNRHLEVTVPFVLYGIFRYLYLVYMRQAGGSPEEVLLRDRHMLVTVVMCAILTIGILYWHILPS
jgi:4-hydroxybenzoate polyprenyltransferase